MKRPTRCALCKTALPIPPTNGASGYAVLNNGWRICYPCADSRQRKDLLDRTRPFVAYLNGKTVTTWTGGKLMDVTQRRHCKLTRRSFFHDQNSFVSIHAVDCHGGHWSGRGSDGIAIRLRPVGPT